MVKNKYSILKGNKFSKLYFVPGVKHTFQWIQWKDSMAVCGFPCLTFKNRLFWINAGSISHQHDKTVILIKNYSLAEQHRKG